MEKSIFSCCLSQPLTTSVSPTAVEWAQPPQVCLHLNMSMTFSIFPHIFLMPSSLSVHQNKDSHLCKN